MLVTTLPLDSTSRTHFKPSLTQAPTSCFGDPEAKNCTVVSHRRTSEPPHKAARKHGHWSTLHEGGRRESWVPTGR